MSCAEGILGIRNPTGIGVEEKAYNDNAQEYDYDETRRR